MAKLPADHLANPFEARTFNSLRTIRFASSHPNLLFDKGTNVMALEVIYDI